jgi:hypothetical protein
VPDRPKQNPLQPVIDDLAGEYRESRRAARSNGVVPIGNQRLTLARAAKAFAAMSPEQRQTTMEKIGPEETMKIVKHLGRTNGSS